MKEPQKENMSRRLIFSVCILIVIFRFFGLYSLYGIRAISGLTRTIYGHPLVVSNAALQAIGCLGMRACHTNNCPVGIATQKEHLVARLIAETSAKQLTRYFETSISLMKILARACGHDDLSKFTQEDLITWKREMSDLSGVRYGGVGLSKTV